MSIRFRFFLILTALAVSAAVSSAWAGDLFVQGDAARSLRRAEGLVQQKHYKKAAAEFERANDLAGGSCPECLLGVARAYNGAGQIDAALQMTRMALPMFSSAGGRARAYNQLGSLLALTGEMDAAQEAFRKAVELDSSLEPQVRSSLARALLKRAALAEAVAAAARAEREESFVAKGPDGS
jgi:tetratricopeptide (TPR) repeat protein